MGSSIRWGILGTGNIARQFAGDFSTATRGVISVVGSRSIESARAFAKAHGLPAAVGSYEELIASRDVDAIYVSLPNAMHHEWTIKALRAGKHVLCEKPIAMDAGQAREMFDVAQREGRVLAEAFMYRSHPLIHAAMDAVAAGKIGRVRFIRTSFSFRVWRPGGNIRFDRALGGGVLMDTGCYCINFSRFVAGTEPTAVHAISQFHPSGVDELTTGLLQFPGNVSASFTCGMAAQADNTATICGDEGYIEIPVPWKPPLRGAAWSIAYSTPPKMDIAAGIAPAPRPREMHSVDAGKGLFALEADDFAQTILDGKPARMSREDSIGNMRVLDEMRRQVGLVF